VIQKGYLTLDPLTFAHPELSFLLPAIFVLVGGFGLPGGAVWIERAVLKNRWWDSAVSAAGPLANLLCMIAIAIPFALGMDESFEAPQFWGALAFLGYLQATAIVLNMLPLPGLDGFGVLRPHLPYDMQAQSNQIAGMVGFGLLALMFVPPFAEAIGNMSRALVSLVGIDFGDVYRGYQAFKLK
jgi:Zn-dependent protease